jgi:hypothetical protein
MTNKNKFIQIKTEVTFKCLNCVHQWDGEPDIVEDDVNLAHPHRYFAACPCCNEQVQQVAWQRALYSSYVKSTGPKTIEGKAASAANLEGHPTPEESFRTRFNGMKHGAFAKTAMYFPAKPGKYAFCTSCDIDHDYCRAQPACIKRTELVMRHLVAYQNGDPRLLRDLNAVQQANLRALFDDMLISVISDGVALKTPAYAFDKDGNFNLARYVDDKTNETVQIMDVKAHPLLKPLFDLMSKNNMTLADDSMTNKVQVDQDIEMGRLGKEEQEKESALEFKQAQQSQLENLQQLIADSREKIKTDPVLAEYKAQNGNEQ